MKKVIMLTVLAVLFIIPFAIANNETVVVPYMLKAPKPITVDGILDEWSFAFPVEFNHSVMKAWMRFGSSLNLPDDDEDCSGVIYQMYDDNNFYFAARVKDDAPGHFSEVGWAADAIEFYFANWDVGKDKIIPSDLTLGWVDKSATGRYSFQLAIKFSASLDSVEVDGYYGPGGTTGNGIVAGAVAKYKLTDDGYILEGKIPYASLTSKTTGNTFSFPAGGRIPAAWSLYDIDETELSSDFTGYAYTKQGYGNSNGICPGWQVMDVLPIARGSDLWVNEAQFDFVAPYIKKASPGGITVDGDLSEWSFCFPADFNQDVMTNGMRAVVDGWVSPDDGDCSGTLYQMYDEDNFYFAAKVVDDLPGYFSEALWAADALEYYMDNWNIGDNLIASEEAGQWIDDPGTGEYGFQLNLSFSTDEDLVRLLAYNGPISPITNGEAKYKLTDDGYILEGRIPLTALSSAATGIAFSFTEGYRIPFAWSLYDMDETMSSNDFKGYAYTKAGFPAYLGASPGWQYVDVKGLDFIDALDDLYTGVEEKTALVPQALTLINAPNPFNPSTDIHFTLKNTGKTSLKIYSASGRLVKTVMEGKSMNAGANRIAVNMSELPSGCYVAVLEQGQQRITHKMLLMK